MSASSVEGKEQRSAGCTTVRGGKPEIADG